MDDKAPWSITCNRCVPPLTYSGKNFVATVEWGNMHEMQAHWPTVRPARKEVPDDR